MKRLVFTCVLTGIPDMPTSEHEEFVRKALMAGDRHQNYFLYSRGEIEEERESNE